VTNEKLFVVANIINTCGPLPEAWQTRDKVKEIMSQLEGFLALTAIVTTRTLSGTISVSDQRTSSSSAPLPF